MVEEEKDAECFLEVTVQIYMHVKSVFAGLAFGASRRLRTGSI